MNSTLEKIREDIETLKTTITGLEICYKFIDQDNILLPEIKKENKKILYSPKLLVYDQINKLRIEYMELLEKEDWVYE